MLSGHGRCSRPAIKGDRRVCGALAEPDLKLRATTDPPRFRPPMTRMYGPAVRCKRAETEMKIVRYRQLVDRTADEELVTRIRTQIAELEQARALREIGE
ncbi:hypothetical protein ACVWVY_002387 [Bradyrhizobium sp. URHC0002]